jgi:hypothetical protein
MLGKRAALAVAIVILCGSFAWRGEAASTTAKASVTVTRAPYSSSPYTGSQCDSNTYSGQCASGNCQCVLVSGNFCEARVNSKGSKNKSCSIFMTVDNGLATGSPGCSPLFGVIQGFSGEEAVAVEFFFTGTDCAIKGTNLTGGWALDNAASYSSGEGTFTGSIAGSLSLSMTGTVTPK